MTDTPSSQRDAVATNRAFSPSVSLSPKPSRYEMYEGQNWTIEERHHGGVWSLIFSADGVTRRVWHYPSNWRQLDVASLFALTHSPAAIRRRLTSPS
jgi:hypothetical protein